MTRPGHPGVEPRTELGRLIRAARHQYGMTQAQFAELLETSGPMVRHAETTPDERNVGPSLLARLAALPEVDTDQLYAAAGRIPPDIAEALTGDVSALRKVRKVLHL